MKLLAIRLLAASGLFLLFAPTVLAQEDLARQTQTGNKPLSIQGIRVDKTITWQTTFRDLAGLKERTKPPMTVECPGNGMLSNIEGNDFGTGNYDFTADSSICSAAVWWSHKTSSPRMIPQNGGIVKVVLRLVDIAPRNSRKPITAGGVTLTDFSSRTDIYKIISERPTPNNLDQPQKISGVWHDDGAGMSNAQITYSQSGNKISANGSFIYNGVTCEWNGTGTITNGKVEHSVNYTKRPPDPVWKNADGRFEFTLASDGMSMTGTWFNNNGSSGVKHLIRQK